MRIRRLYIGDFGLIRNQILDNLGSGLVVIGGPNRAGKTSFMQVLRYLAYGFPKGANLPPPTHEYHVEASFALEDELWDVHLTGYSKPRVTGPKGESLSVLYGEVDMFTYHQLFTISLDELRLLPEGLSRDDQDKLQSVLLGAGLADVARLPKLKDELEAAADKIGGKHGNPRVRMFKPYHTAIQGGIARRDAALELMDGYRARVEKLADTDADIAKLREHMQEAKQQAIRLEALLHNYADYQRWSELNDLLSDPIADALLYHYPEELWERAKALKLTYETALTDYQDKLIALRQRVEGEKIEERQAALLARASEIELALRNLSGISARIEAYERKVVERQTEERRILADMDTIEPTWQGDFAAIDGIAEQVDQATLTRAVEGWKLADQAVGIAERLQQLTTLDFTQQFRIYAVGATLAAVVGIIIGLRQPLAGISLVVIGAVGLGLYFLHRTLSDGEARSQRRGLVEQLIEIAGKADLTFDLEELDGFIGQARARRDQVRQELELYRSVLGLPEATAMERYGEKLAAVQKLHERIMSLRRKDEELKEDLDRVYPSLQGLYDLSSRLGYAVEPPQAGTGSFNRLAMVVEEIWQDLQMAKAVEMAKMALANIKGEIKGLISEGFILGEVAVSGDGEDLLGQLQEVIQAGEQRALYEDAVRERQILAQRIQHSLGRREITAFQAALGDEIMPGDSGEEIQVERDCLRALGLLYKEYLSSGDLEEALAMVEQTSLHMASELEQLEQEREDLYREIESLDTDKTLAEAQKIIDEARRGLEPLAYEYSVNKVAALLLDSVYKQFLDEVRDTLLIRASEILRELTAGEYQEILPLDELTEAGFQVTLGGGEKLLPTALSRGTTEQLFLAVRLGRIQEIEPALPVILDDSFVNFDTSHALQAVQALMGLSKRNQVFVLTCHPELVDMIRRVQGSGPVQYWQLDRGVFAQVSGPKLVELLGVES